jgi:hypothetical protein
MKRILLHLLVLVFVQVISALIGNIWAHDLLPGTKAQIYILLDFDGDPDFPGITWQHQTHGLDPFSGVILGLPPSKREELKARITELVQQDYTEFDNVHIVDNTEGLSFWYTWGIDDKTYIFSVDPDLTDDNEPDYVSPIQRDHACPETGEFFCLRLYGKAGAYPNPNEKDRFGTSIFYPTFARTFAGSFSIPENGPARSRPALIYGNTYPGILPHAINVEYLAQAIANNASHEIAHLFRVSHPPNGCGADCANDLMLTLEEWAMAKNNMRFFYPPGLEELRKTLTIASNADWLEPNNSITTASQVENQQLTLTLHDPFDEDYIKYVAPATTDKNLCITITHEFPVEDQALRRLISVEIRKNNGAALPMNVINTGWQIIDGNVNPGDEYLIYVSQFEKRLPVQYRLQIGVGDDVFEADGGNNTAATATTWPASLICDYSGLRQCQ